jgi:hypothetical protein
MVLSDWSARHNPARVRAQLLFRPVENSATLIVNDASTNFTAGQLPRELAIAQTFHNDPAARVLTLGYTAAAAPAQGITVRITGTDEFDQPQQEDVVINQAAAALRAYFTLGAYRTVTSVRLIAISGAAQGASTLRVGVCALVATTGTAGTQANGATAGRFKGFSLPLLLGSIGTDPTGAASALYTSELWGQRLHESAAAASLTSVMPRGAGFLYDPVWNVLVLDDVTLFIIGNGDAVTDNIKGVLLTMQTNRGE